MATIDVGEGGGGRRRVDPDVPLVPFIDLLLCCLMFLLVTAAWNQLAGLQSQGIPPGAAEATAPATDTPNEVWVHVTHTGYQVATTVGDRTQLPDLHGERDVSGLVRVLKSMRSWSPMALVTADDGVSYHELIQTVDLVTGVSFERVRVTGM